jgi:diacylglycerol kinase family enzyme
MTRTLVILNAKAGTLRDLGAVDVEARVKRPLEASGRQVEVVLAKGAAIGAAIERGKAGDYDEIVLGGGDGTVSRALGELAYSGKTIGVLPLGTVNLLGRDLGLPNDLGAAVAALLAAEPQSIDLARVNGRVFHSISGLGFFSQIARAREEVQVLGVGRFFRFIVAAWRAFIRSGRLNFRIEIDGCPHDVETYAFLVTVNPFDGTGWRRTHLDDGLLEVHVAYDAPRMVRLRTALGLLAGTWRDDPGIASFKAERVVVSRGRPRAWVSTDGELVREELPLTYEILPRAVTVLMPARESIAAASPQPDVAAGILGS